MKWRLSLAPAIASEEMEMGRLLHKVHCRSVAALWDVPLCGLAAVFLLRLFFEDNVKQLTWGVTVLNLDFNGTCLLKQMAMF